MNKTITAIKRGVTAAMAGTVRPRQYEAGGKPVVCSHCGGSIFEWHGEGLIGTRFKNFIGGYALACSQCSHLEQFAKKPVEIEPAA